MKRQCANPTCDRTVPIVGYGRPREYCSKKCREIARWPHGRMHLSRVNIPMSTYHRLNDQAKLDGVTFEEHVSWLLFLAADEGDE